MSDVNDNSERNDGPSSSSSAGIKEGGRTDGRITGQLAAVVQDNLVPFEPADDAKVPRKWFDLLSPSECREYHVPHGHVLVGDSHVTRGDISVLAGVPGCGKSRLSVALAVAGATGADWMGLPVHARFRTLILQAENGPARLKAEFADIDTGTCELDDWLRVTPPPIYGMPFDDPDFRLAIRDTLEAWKPGVIVLDPFNRITMDDKVKDFRKGLDNILETLPEGPERPAIVIVHHLRKQGGKDGKKRGRELLSELSGSYVLGSAPRCVMILEPASSDTSDDRVVLTCAKNNNGHMGESTAWHRRNGLFQECDDFDWSEYYGGSGGEPKKTVTLEHLAEVFGADGQNVLKRKAAVQRLKDVAGIGRTAAYDALKADGPFGAFIDDTAAGLLFKAPIE
ncbi:MAG: AAA family ATPase [Verrucomicrobiae bacterium]|nr:AAA family ATPase [Verrucomicrobiae bacterium]